MYTNSNNYITCSIQDIAGANLKMYTEKNSSRPIGVKVCTRQSKRDQIDNLGSDSNSEQVK